MHRASFPHRFPKGTAALALLALLMGCESPGATPNAEPSGAPKALAKSKQISLTEPGLLFIWVAEDGSFQTTTDPKTIVSSAQKRVRVIAESLGPGDPATVYVADLSASSEHLSVETLPREKWDELGAAQRKARAQAAKPPEAPEAKQTEPAASGEIRAIVYGADWCRPCHDAEAYLKSKGLQVLKRDIEEDSSAAQEMQTKLRAAGLRSSGIPVLDVGGTMLLGFSRSAVDTAVARAKKGG